MRDNYFNSYDLFIILLILLSIVVYLAAAMKHKKKPWPKLRSILWVTGFVCILVSIVGPIAKLSHHLFVFHMIMHLLLGMLAPFFIALSRPITLLLTSLKTQHARRVSRLLRCAPVRLLTHPISTLLLNIGGLWVLYTSTVFNVIHESTFWLNFVHIHLFFAGYLFTISIIAIEPISHKYSYFFRSFIMVLALAGHDILSKLLFSNPLDSFDFNDVQFGAVLMYYGGDFVDLLLITALCYFWYNSSNSNKTRAFI
ncbi:cytochrome c oxidase assembly protein [Gottfriedia acidiceleris]|uniref:cytochrome c oxidase assembly protein n=1 Tax=Gottfriedia acidiceleris TaxID=371036 RepID=UPI00101C1E3D|nr:cytochrome c oxidase assembly protein [Gottfriedia acidiceleris]